MSPDEPNLKRMAALAMLAVAVFFLVVHFVTPKGPNIPGPRGLPLLGGALAMLRRDKQGTGSAIVDYFWRNYKVYGEVFLFRLLTKPVVVVSDPELAKHVLATRRAIYLKDKASYKAFGPMLGGGLVVSEGAHWAHSRALVSPSFHFEALREVALVQFVGAANRMVERWGALERGNLVDVAEEFRVMTLEIIGAAALSLVPGEPGPAQELPTLYNSVISEMMLRFWYPFRAWLPTAADRHYRAQLARLDDMIDERVADRRAAGAAKADDGESADLLDMLLAAEDEHGSSLSNLQIRCEMKTFLLAGHETSSMWLAWALHLLAQPENADVLRRLRAEAVAVVGTSGPVDVTYEQFGELKYTQMVLKEVMRVLPPVPLLMRETAEPDRLGPYELPKGCGVAVDIWTLHHSPKIWGPDAHKFNPEHFADGAERGRPAFAYLPFSLGPRNCIGQNFAHLEARIVLATLVARFDFRAPKPGPLVMDKYDVPLRPIEGVMLEISPAGGS